MRWELEFFRANERTTSSLTPSSLSSLHLEAQNSPELTEKNKTKREVKKYRRSGPQNRSMITHRTAESTSTTMSSRMSQITDNDSLDNNSLVSDSSRDPDTESSKSIRSIGGWKGPRNIVAFIALVWVGQVAVAFALKKYGVIDKDLNEMVAERVIPVAERVIPELQQKLEHSFDGFTWPILPYNESQSNYYWALFNDTINRANLMQERSRPGLRLAQKGASVKQPLIMIPGFITSGLEVWEGHKCAEKYFRQKMWGGIGSARQFIMEKDCVLQHLALNTTTGMDPDNIRIRAAEGFAAADYFMANYWVWGKIILALADVGYDASTMSMEPYDWRLSFPKLEERDGYLTKLKFKIESFHKVSGKKVILASHSLGAILVHYFMTWVTTPEKQGGGGGGKDWVDKHIDTYVNIAGAHLGVPKATSALLSGEMRDTIIMGTVGTLVEQWLGKRLRRDLWSSWGSLWTMLPKGGDALWNSGADARHNLTGDDGLLSYLTSDPTTRDYYGPELTPMFVMTDNTSVDEVEELTCSKESLLDLESEKDVNDALKTFASFEAPSVEDANSFLLKYGSGLGPSHASSKAHSFDHSDKPSSRTWHDISRTPLPSAPNLKIYCLYGVGLNTERSYFYKKNTGDGAQGGDNKSSTSTASLNDPPFILDPSVDDPDNNIMHGVKYVDGDQSVPLLSLGYMCADAWQRKDSGLNPSNTKVITREYMHKQEFTVDDPMRSGPYSADHVDILGNENLMEDFIKVVTGFERESVEKRILSDIEKIAKHINSQPGGGLFKNKQKRKRKRKQKK